jgi:hypothetical protein
MSPQDQVQCSKKRYLANVFDRSGPEREDRQKAVRQLFHDLRDVGEYDHVTGKQVRPPARLLNVELLSYLSATGKLDTKTKNHFLVAQVMRLSCPKPGKHYQLLKPANEPGHESPREETAEIPEEPDYIELGKYDSMVWFRFVSRSRL